MVVAAGGRSPHNRDNSRYGHTPGDNNLQRCHLVDLSSEAKPGEV